MENKRKVADRLVTGRTIIANNEKFRLKYADEYLPKCSYGDRDVEFLLSQMGAAVVKGSREELSIIKEPFFIKMKALKDDGDHGSRMAAAYIRRLDMYVMDSQEISQKYIINWLADKETRR